MDVLLESGREEFALDQLVGHLRPLKPLIDAPTLSKLTRLDSHSATAAEQEEQEAFVSKKKPKLPKEMPPLDEFNLTTLATPYHDNYHFYENITRFADTLATTFPSLVKIETIGTSAEGRDIIAIRLHKFVNVTNGDDQEPSESRAHVKTSQGRAKVKDDDRLRVFYLQGGQHAREVSPFVPLSHFKHTCNLPTIT